MRARITDAIEAMTEGDRLYGQGVERLEPPTRGATAPEIASAEDYFERAAKAYLVGAAEYQHAQRNEDHASFESDGLSDLIRELDTQLAAEAVAALQAAKRTPQEAADGSVYQAQAFAENLRDRFSRAMPEVFQGAAVGGVNRSDSRLWSR